MKNRVKNLPQHRFAKQFVLISALSALLVSIAFLALPGRTLVLAQVNLPWNYTTVADFTGCQSIADSTNVTITNNSGGEIRLASTATFGNFTSCVIDAGGQIVWGSLVANSSLPVGTSVVYETRTSANGTIWSGWAAVNSSGVIISPPGRYIQYRATLDPSGGFSPEIRQIVLTPANSARDTTVADFNGCGVFTDTSVSNLRGGELRLKPIFEDYFDGTTLDTTDWITQVVNSGYNNSSNLIQVSNGMLTLDGTRVRTNQMITATDIPLAVEGRLRMAQPFSGTGFGDFGLGKFTQAPGPPNILFITDDLTRTFANDYSSGAGAPQRTQINGYDWTQFHEFRFWTDNSQVIYYVDNTPVVTHSLSITTPLYLWLLTITPDRDMVADWVRIARYQSSGQ
jgi:hypothetical protein